MGDPSPYGTHSANRLHACPGNVGTCRNLHVQLPIPKADRTDGMQSCGREATFLVCPPVSILEAHANGVIWMTSPRGKCCTPTARFSPSAHITTIRLNVCLWAGVDTATTRCTSMRKTRSCAVSVVDAHQLPRIYTLPSSGRLHINRECLRAIAYVRDPDPVSARIRCRRAEIVRGCGSIIASP